MEERGNCERPPRARENDWLPVDAILFSYNPAKDENGGIDIYHDGKPNLDVDEKIILLEVKDWKHVWMVLSPIRRQGILPGRGKLGIPEFFLVL